MSAPIFYADASVIATLPYPQGYKYSQIATWVDHLSINGSLRRDFTSLHKKYQFHLDWEILTAAELANLQSVWYQIVRSVAAISYQDIEGINWNVEVDKGSFKLDWALATNMIDGSAWQTTYTANLIFVAISSGSLTLP